MSLQTPTSRQISWSEHDIALSSSNSRSTATTRSWTFSGPIACMLNISFRKNQFEEKQGRVWQLAGVSWRTRGAAPSNTRPPYRKPHSVFTHTQHHSFEQSVLCQKGRLKVVVDFDDKGLGPDGVFQIRAAGNEIEVIGGRGCQAVTCSVICNKTVGAPMCYRRHDARCQHTQSIGAGLSPTGVGKTRP